MPTSPKAQKRFPKRTRALLAQSRMLGIRAGDDHRFTGIWFVMIGDRVFVRPYFDKASGWYRTYRKNPIGAIRLGEREIPVRARFVRGEGLFDAVDAAYAEKYDTQASQKWVRGFRLPRRRKTTTELLPG
ncbi:MAG TPA: DUF2255 family protein [Thermoanaerobaculia bacterium]|nr:DUF2255 family protein [Thermoanaerobaculia bacterium]